MSEKEYISENISTPVTKTCRVLVAGGGVGGIAAALAAARHGADVLLLEREFALGGLATLGLITYYLPICDGRGHQIIYGIGEELLRLSVLHGHEGKFPQAWFDGGDDEESRKERISKRFRVGFNAPLFMLETEALLLRSGVRILYGTSVVAATTENGKITHVICENKSGRFAVKCGVVVDATGDADAAKLAGAETAEFSQGNVLAAWYYFYNEAGRQIKVLGASDIPEEDKPTSKPRTYLSPERFSGLDGDEISRMNCLSHAATLGDWKAAHLADPTLYPDAIPSIPQLRMTRRIVGTVTPDTSDDRRHFDDSIGLSGHWRKRGPVYEIPFGSIRSVNIKNLLAAGRDTAATDAMWDNVRVIPTCAVTGEAAGTAAAMFDDFSALSKSDIKDLQEELRRGGVRIHVGEIPGLD